MTPTPPPIVPGVKAPLISLPATDFGRPAAAAEPEPPLPRIQGAAGDEPLELVAPEPLHSSVDFRRVWRLAERLRGDGFHGSVRLWLSTALDDLSPYEALPVDHVVPMAAGTMGCPRLSALAGGRPGPAVLLRDDPIRPPRLPAGSELEQVATFELWRGRLATGAECRAASARLDEALRLSTPRWLISRGAPWPIRLDTDRPRVLFHQARRHVGDTLWQTPLIAELRRVLPQADVTLVGPRLAHWVLTENPHIDRILTDDPSSDALTRRLLKEIDALPPFDLAFLCFGRFERWSWVARAMKRRARYRVNLEYFSAAYDHRVPDPRFTHEGWFYWGAQRSPTMLVRALDPLGAFSTEEDTRRISTLRGEYHVSAAARAWAELALSVHGIGPEEPFVVLAPGGYSSTRWPASRFARLARELAEGAGVHVLVEGAPAESDLVHRIAHRARTAGRHRRRGGRIIPCCDPFEVLAALLERSRLLVSNDTGAIHLAEALGAPTLYFSMYEKLSHSHPVGEACWALYDEQKGVPGITVEQTLGAVAQMKRERLISFA